MPFNALSIIGTITGALITYGGWYKWREKQLIENTPRSTVRSISIGRTELHGTINTDKPLEAPLTGEPAVCYEYKIEQERESKHGSDWHTVKQGHKTTTATLTDDTGSVSVDLDGITIEQGTTWQEDSHSFDDPSEDLQQRLDDLGVNWEGWFGGNHHMRYKETRIAPGDTVYLLGTARDNPDVKDGTAQQGHNDIRITKNNNHYIIATGDEANLKANVMKQIYWLLGLGIPILTASLIYMIAY